MSLSTEIQRLRASLNLTQAEAAKLWRVSPGSVRTWEQGKNEPEPLKLERIQQLTADYLAGKPVVPASSVSPASPDAPVGPRKRGRPPKAKPTTPPKQSAA